jgi:hypothetical protein
VSAALLGDTFTGVDGSDMAGKFTCTNVPTCLSVAITKANGTNVTVALRGNAAAHAAADSVTNLTISFNGAAFSASSAQSVTNSRKADLAIDFRNPPFIWYVSASGLDVPPGDGSQANPWATIAKAISVAANWDTIHVLPGELTEYAISVSKPLTIEGEGAAATIVQAAATRGTAAGRVFNITADAILRNMTIRHGHVASSGAAAMLSGGHTLWLQGCTLTANDCTAVLSDYYGGAVYSTTAGTLFLTDCEVSHTESSASGGVVLFQAFATISNCVIRNNRGMAGAGGIYANGPLRIYNSTISDNFAGGSGGGVHEYQGSLAVYDSTLSGNVCSNHGGAVYFYFAPGPTFVQCTIYGNTALSAASLGGGMYSYSADRTTIRNCTIYGNACPLGGGGGVYQHSYGALDIASTILAGNSAVLGPDHYNTYYNPLFTERYNLVGSTNGSLFTPGQTNRFGSYVGTAAAPLDPRLAPLAGNGGRNQTCAPLADSLALDHGWNPLGLIYDQRGVPNRRLVGGTVDIGAVEYAGSTGALILLR